MSKFSIIPNGGGTARYSGCPTFSGTYMKPGMLEFREVASPTPIDFAVGDYVAYPRTGFTYRLYGIPQVKKQARSTEYGGAFVYQNVQFFDDSKKLEICPFRDLVAGDNRIHFSTQPSISTFEAVDGIARRLQACLEDMYGTGSWVVRVATSEENPSIYPLVEEARDFTVSGVNILEALNKVYEIWPDVGWVYAVESGVNTIVIGGGGISSTSSFLYGKGNGLTSITRTIANADELANRIFPYGANRNMLPRWYNNQNIKDAESVDIQNLMLPVDAIPSLNWMGWGKTNVDGTMMPDAAKANVDDLFSILRLGLRPKTVYFDGSGEYPAIYPSIRETTIGMVRAAIGDSTAKYYPSTEIYTDPDERVDKVLSAQDAFDSGKAGADGKSSTDVGYIPYDHSVSSVIPVSARSVHTAAFASGTIALSGTGKLNINLSYPSIGLLSGCSAVDLDFIFAKIHGGVTTTIYTKRLSLNPGDAGSFSIPEGTITYSGSGTIFESGDSLAVTVNLILNNQSGESDTTAILTNATGSMSVRMSYHRDKSFKISLRQLGFDINEQANLGEGKTIAMRSGKCAGRSFVINSVQYDADTDSWVLDCWRSEDESLSQWFPNTDYPIEVGDEFVLLDIAMPDIYVRMAEQRLLQAARELLADTAVERWQYIPEIDAKFMVENNRTIVAGQNMMLQDDDVIGVSPISVLVDSLTISEGEAAIPTYKVTLRDRKRKTFTESQGADSISSKPVSNATEERINQMSSNMGESYFTLDESGNVTLKPEYQNLWVPGWLSAGGVGFGGGGGGGVSYLGDLSDVGITSPSAGDILVYDPTQAKPWVNVQPSSIFPEISLVNGQDYSTLSVNNVTADFYTKDQVDSLISGIDLSDYVQKVTGGTAGNLVSLSSDGGILDSGYEPSEIGEVIIGTQEAATGSWTGNSRLATATDFKSGYRFTYWLPYAGSGNATLTLTFKDGTTKAINLYYKGASRLTTHISAGNKIDFLYLENANVNGTQYTGAWIDPGYQDGNNYERLLSTYERRFIYSASAPLYRYKICGYNEGKLVPLTITNQASSSRIDKTPVSFGIDPKMGLVYYSTTTNVTSVSTVIAASVLYNELPTTNGTYNFNDSLPIYRDVFLKGEIRSDGLFYLDTTTHKSWYVFAPNRPSDGAYNSVFVEGCYYMYVGPTYSSANYMQFKYNNPVFQFLNGRLVPLDTKGDSVYSADEFYARISPNMQGCGSQTLSELRGRSLVWNQLVTNGNFDGTTSWGMTANSTGSASGNVLTATASANVTAVCPNQAINTIKGHIYYVSFKYKVNSAVTGDTLVREGYFGGTSTVWFADAVLLVRNAWVSVQLFVNTTSNNGRFYIGPYLSSGTSPILNAGETAEFKDVRLFDLTQMFGAGNEPKNVAQFEALFPNAYYPYNAGTLLSCNLTGVKTIGRNLFDKTDVKEGYSLYDDTGAEVQAPLQWCSGWIPALPETTYYIQHVIAIGSGYCVHCYDGSKNHIEGKGIGTTGSDVSGTFTTVPNTAYIRIRSTLAVGYQNVSLNLSDPSFNGKYEPHKVSTLPLNIPTMTSGGTAIFPDGMKSAGSVYDYAIVDDDGYIRKVVKRVGNVDLGTLTWYYYQNQPCFYSNKINDLPSSASAICEKYVTNTKSASQSFDKELSTQPYFQGGVVFVKDSSFGTDATAFKTAMSGVPLHYQLTTPIEYTLDTPINASANYYEGGMQYVLPEQGATPTSAPFRGVVKYGLTTGEIVDKMEGYLPLTGGTLTGPLTINSTLSVTGASTFGSAITLNGDTAAKKRIYFGTEYIELDQYGFHFSCGLYSDDFVSAGGIGQGGGSGSVAYLNDLSDVTAPNPSNGDLLSWNGTAWVNIAQSSITPDLSAYALKVGNSDYNFKVNSLKFANTGHDDSFLSADNGPGPLYFEYQRPKWTYWKSNPRVPTDPDTQESKYFAFREDIPTSLKNPYALTFGSNTYDGSEAKTITASDLGALTSVAFSDLTAHPTSLSGYGITDAKIESGVITLGSNTITPLTSHQTVNLASGTNNGTLKITTAAGTTDNIAVTGLQALAFKASLVASDIPDISGTYVTLATAQTISGAKTFSSDLTLSENLVMGSAKHIDLGPVRIEYDSDTMALHITTNLTGNDAPSIGLFADGFVASGGVGTQGGGGGGYGVESITTNEDGTVDFHFTGGDVTTVDLNHEHPQYNSKMAETSQPSGGFLPDVVYELGTLTGSVTFSLASAVSGQVNHYFWTFTAGSTAPTITWPSGITWADSAPTITASKKYQISILDGVAAYMEG